VRNKIVGAAIVALVLAASAACRPTPPPPPSGTDVPIVFVHGYMGSGAQYRSIALRKDCCGIRKLEPLGRALAGQRAWITGLRREQSGARAEVPLVDTTEAVAGGRIKLNPLAEWSWGDVWHYIAEHGVDYNPLHDEFFPSIGCAPCTRAISLGEDFRAGRWWWEEEAAKECGLHVAAPAANVIAGPIDTRDQRTIA
jgi:phosphoadenosine phosphosulfate reductase